MGSNARKVGALVGSLLLLAFHGFGCGTTSDGPTDAPQLQGQATTCDGTPKAGCSCPTPGQISECGRAVCKDGIRKCIKIGQEFSAWGPCHSASTGESCGETSDSGGTASGGRSGGTSGSSGGTSGGTTSSGGTTDTCVCKPGAQRWCDTAKSCNWGIQTCTPAGQWGFCTETSSRPSGCYNPLDPSYDQDCCKSSGQCCQNVLKLIEPWKSDPSVPDSFNCAAFLCQ